MADQSDVETALATLSAAALYPDGQDNASIPGPPCRVYRGWPTPAALDADLAQGRINVTIFAGNAAPRSTTRFPETWLAAPLAPTLTASVSNTSVNFGGIAQPGQIAGVRADGQPYVYRTQIDDTPALVAATIASLIRINRIVNLRDTSLDIPGAKDIVARIVTDTPALQEIRRQRLAIRVTCWCPSPATRDATAAAIDTNFATKPFISLADGSVARLTFAGGAVLDQSQDAALYRRDLLYDVEYATTIIQSQPAMLFGSLEMNALQIIA
jgi:hypothetical protein